MSEHIRHVLDDLGEDGEIERGETGVRILLTLLFTLIAAALEAVLTLLIVFELGWALVTKQPPTERVRDLANRLVAYYYRIGRYMTYNDACPPFPFTEFPDVLEGDGWEPAIRESDRDRDDDYEDARG